MVSLLLSFQAGTERPELSISCGRGSLGKTIRIGLDFPPPALLTWLLGELAAWHLTKWLPRELAALAVCHGAAAAWSRLLAGQAAATEELLFPNRKIKIPGENMPILQKELFLVQSRSGQACF